MKAQTFKKGIKVPHYKLTADAPLIDCPAPDTVYIPLSQHIGKPALPAVVVGAKVQAGTLIGSADGIMSANVFSSVSGVVKAIEKRKTVTGSCEHIVIQNDGTNGVASLGRLDDMSRDGLLSRVREAGLVGMGGAGFPTHVKFSPKKPVDTFIINAAECEPFITCDHRLMLEHTEETLRGALMLARILGLDEFYIGIEDNKLAAADALTAAADRLNIKAKVCILKSKYPQGAEKQLIYAVTGRKVPAGGLPADVGVVVDNVHTAYAIFDAVENGTPLYRRALTVSGNVERPSNIWALTGTLYSHCASFCGGEKDDCVKTISGGPMMGFALEDLGYSITKTSGSVLFLNAATANLNKPLPCINCGKCARVCPMNLMPMYIDAYTLRGDYSAAKRYGALNCIECGCCAYNCPAKRPIVQSVRLCKRRIKELGL